MTNRDPRTDPKAGDVVSIKGEIFEVLELDGVFLAYEHRSGEEVPEINIAPLGQWRDNMVGAEVLHATD